MEVRGEERYSEESESIKKERRKTIINTFIGKVAY